MITIFPLTHMVFLYQHCTTLLCRCFCITTQSTRSAISPKTPGTTAPLAMSVGRRATTSLWPSRQHSRWVLFHLILSLLKQDQVKYQILRPISNEIKSLIAKAVFKSFFFFLDLLSSLKSLYLWCQVLTNSGAWWTVLCKCFWHLIRLWKVRKQKSKSNQYLVWFY